MFFDKYFFDQARDLLYNQWGEVLYSELNEIAATYSLVMKHLHPWWNVKRKYRVCVMIELNSDFEYTKINVIRTCRIEVIS